MDTNGHECEGRNLDADSSEPLVVGLLRAAPMAKLFRLPWVFIRVDSWCNNLVPYSFSNDPNRNALTKGYSHV